MKIDTGDTVKHGPTGESWVVAYVEDNRLAWCGWPPGWAELSDCTLVRKASEEQRIALLEKMAKSGRNDRRTRYAKWRLREISGEAQG